VAEVSANEHLVHRKQLPHLNHARLWQSTLDNITRAQPYVPTRKMLWYLRCDGTQDNVFAREPRRRDYQRRALFGAALIGEGKRNEDDVSLLPGIYKPV
jgi:hypothetical protein